jgi:hypothetical protein
MVRPNAATATCDNGETLVSAVCIGRVARSPTTTETSASCGNGSTATILCAKP